MKTGTAIKGEAMKRAWLVCCLIAVAAGVEAEEKYREFTDTQGRTIRGRVVSYDASDKEVFFELENGRTAKVPIKIFSEPDQAYIEEWSLAEDFLKESNFRIDVERRKEKKDQETNFNQNRGAWYDYIYWDHTKVWDTHYEIVFDNRSQVTMSNLEVEYCIFYEQEEIGRGKNVTKQGVYCGKKDVETIASSKKKTIKTDAVSIYKQEKSATHGTSGENVQDGDVHGIWIRVNMKLPSGTKVTRELCYPDSISNSRTWATRSQNVGMN